VNRYSNVEPTGKSLPQKLFAKRTVFKGEYLGATVPSINNTHILTNENQRKKIMRAVSNPNTTGFFGYCDLLKWVERCEIFEIFTLFRSLASK